MERTEQPAAPAAEDNKPESPAPRYVGFWVRVLASLIDTVLLVALLLPVIYGLYGESLLESGGQLQGTPNLIFNYLLPLIIILLFWTLRSATPGKLLLKAKIVDEDSLGKPKGWQWVVRYLGYYVSTLLLGLGFFWVGWDPRKQGFHDKLARTVVVYED